MAANVNGTGILIISPITIIMYIKHTFYGSGRIYDAVLIIDNQVFGAIARGRNIDNLTGGVEHAVIKGHRGRRIRPNRIVSLRTDKGSIFERCGRVAPVEGLTLDHAVLYNGIIGACKTKVIDST